MRDANTQTVCGRDNYRDYQPKSLCIDVPPRSKMRAIIRKRNSENNNSSSDKKFLGKLRRVEYKAEGIS